jgi:hypothetical protein
MSFPIIRVPVREKDIAAVICNLATNRGADSGTPAHTSDQRYFSFQRFLVFHTVGTSAGYIWNAASNLTGNFPGIDEKVCDVAQFVYRPP